eukprot:c31652_g1_i1 orf=112-273(+)
MIYVWLSMSRDKRTMHWKSVHFTTISIDYLVLMNGFAIWESTHIECWALMTLV